MGEARNPGAPLNAAPTLRLLRVTRVARWFEAFAVASSVTLVLAQRLPTTQGPPAPWLGVPILFTVPPVQRFGVLLLLAWLEVLLFACGMVPDWGLRRRTVARFAVSLALVATLGVWLRVRDPMPAWEADLLATTQRAVPLVEAIRHFDRDHGRPPERLPELVPAYLPSVPETGMRGWPTWRYRAKANGLPMRSRWELWVECPLGMFDREMVYRPSVHPDRKGWWIGGWQYSRH